MNTDKIDLALFKQEITDWHDVAKEGCNLLVTHADKPMRIPQMDKLIQFKTKAEQRAFKLGVIIALSQFSTLPFDTGSDDEGAENE
ncbi:hypothetical protein [Morganella morganii]|uniref:hypothetical protein n=1 Tax=Morganella morganii TaxID=582 RepID=UPI0033147639